MYASTSGMEVPAHQPIRIHKSGALRTTHLLVEQSRKKYKIVVKILSNTHC